MLNNSPLLQRARKESSKRKLYIPRRGRIRIVILLIVILLLLFFFFNRTTSNSSNYKKTEVKSAVVSAQAIDSTQKIKKKKTIQQLPKKISFANLPKIFKTQPLQFNTCIDTIQFKKKTLVCHYSLDTTLQKLGTRYFRRYHPKYGALVALAPRTGKVLSLISYTRSGEVPQGNRLYCRNIFPAASIFKTISAAAALEHGGLTLDSKLKLYGSNHTLYKYQLVKDLKNYREISLKKAFAYSINPVFGRMGIYLLGADVLQDYALKFGFNSNIPFELENEKPIFCYPDSSFTVAEVASGFNQTTLISPLFGALIAAAISNSGEIFKPTVIDSITSLKTGKRVYTSEPKLWRHTVKDITAKKLVTLMKLVAQRGTARKSFQYVKKSFRFNEIDYGGKTGSVDKDSLGKVDWFIGFSRHQSDMDQHISIGVVTVHDDNWTVHSSFIGAEMMRNHIRRIQIAKAEHEHSKKSQDSLDLRPRS